MSGVLRQLLRAADRSDVRLDSVTPQAAAAKSGYSAVPINVVVTGRYFGVQRFLRELRTQAGVAGPHVHASGRLFSVDSVSLAAGDAKLPQLAATIQLNVFTYSGSAAAAAPARAGDVQDRTQILDFDLGVCRREDALMSAIDTHIPTRRVAARNRADRRKKLLLVGLFVLLAAVLAFQLPKLLNSSGSSSSTASPSVTTPATSTPAATGGQSLTGAATSASAKRVRAIRQMTSRDPFVPVIRDERSGVRVVISSASAPASASASSSSSAPPASASASQPTSHSTALTVFPTVYRRPSSPAASQPAVASPAAPTAAVIWTNGKRQVVGVGHTFDVGDATFKLAAVDGTTMRLQVADGSFTGGKRTITIRKGREVILENNATGVLYTLRFAGGTSNGS